MILVRSEKLIYSAPSAPDVDGEAIFFEKDHLWCSVVPSGDMVEEFLS